MGGSGWCTHPDRQTSSDVRILVRKAELACRNSWGQDLWTALEGAEEDQPATPAPAPAADGDAALQITFEDEVTSVVDADIHRARTGEDLNDRVVDQSSLAPENATEEDDRFDLLARGGRDSVHKARNRMLRRLGRQPDAADGVPPVADAPARPEPVTFEPDDFVEEEAPAVEPTSSTPTSPSDDVVLNENTPLGTPRSRRLRRERERTSRPKQNAVVETTPDVPAPAKPSGTTEMSVGDPFNTVPEIATGIDISRFRKGRGRHESDPPAPRQSAESPASDPFEQAIHSAQAIRAAARAERHQRHNHTRRPHILPRAEADARESREEQAAPVAHQPVSGPRAFRAADAAVPDAPPRRARLSTRESPPASDSFEEGQTAVQRRDEARTSWWRGMLRSRSEQDAAPSGWAGSGAEVHADRWHDDLPPAGSRDIQRNSVHHATLDDVAGDLVDPDHTDPEPYFAPTDLDAETGMDSFRRRLFNRPRATVDPQPERRPNLSPNELLEAPEDARYEPAPVPEFDVRRLIENAPTLLDMTIEIAPNVPRQCATCRSYRQSDQGSRGWCTNNWAFTHRQMVNATDLACASTIGCWWLPADAEVWLDDSEPDLPRTPRIDRLIAHLDPLREASGS